MGERIERVEGGQLQKSVKEIAEAHPEVEFALVLARTIDSITSDPEQLRGAVYELARQKLAQLAHEDPVEKARLMKALEVAIAGVESHSKSEIVHRFSVPSTSGLLSPPPLNDTKASPRIAYQPPGNLFDPPAAGRNIDLPVLRWTRPRWLSTGLRYCAVLLFLAVIVGIIIVQRHGVELSTMRATFAHLFTSPASQAPKPVAVAQPIPQPPPTIADVQPKRPLPTGYGVYAESGGKLQELDTLQGRAPDPRVAISAAITKPSQTVLSDGHLKFIVFRRETGGAADAAEVRVIARVKQATTFDPSGKPVTAPSEDVWVIRNISIPYRTAPLKEDPQMYEIEARDPDQALPPGRYALVLKGLAYDFAIDGPVTDKRHCLERLAAANGVFYSECPGR